MVRRMCGRAFRPMGIAVLALVTGCAVTGGGDASEATDENLSVLLSDIHLQTDPAKGYSFTAREFPKRVREILAMRPLPRRVICFGDLTFNGGEPEAYAFLREQIKPLRSAGIDVVLGMGNHDRRKNFLAAFPEAGKDQPVPGRIVYKVNLGHCDLILLDTLDDEEKAVGGEIGPEQEAWLRRELAAAKRPVILGAHHLHRELKVGGGRLFEFMRDSDKVVGWINGHGHSWLKENLYWGGGTNEDVIRSLMLPTGGAWGEIGMVTLRTYPDRAVATLKMIDMVWHDALKPGESRPKVFDAIVSDLDGDVVTFPYERPLFRSKGGVASGRNRLSHETLIAHRGESADAPENTLPAYRMAVERGFGFECDIYLAKDKKLFAFHDSTLKRTTAGANTNRCIDVAWEETVSKLNVGGWGRWKGSSFDPTRPALFSEVLDLARDGRKIYVEVKGNDTSWVPHIKAEIARHANVNPGNVRFISFGRDICAELKRQMPAYGVYCLLPAYHDARTRKDPWSAAEIVALLRRLGVDGVDICYVPALHDAAFVKTVKDAGFSFHVWTVDDIALARQAFEAGADTLTTNCAKKLLDSKQ